MPWAARGVDSLADALDFPVERALHREIESPILCGTARKTRPRAHLLGALCFPGDRRWPGALVSPGCMGEGGTAGEAASGLFPIGPWGATVGS